MTKVVEVARKAAGEDVQGVLRLQLDDGRWCAGEVASLVVFNELYWPCDHAVGGPALAVLDATLAAAVDPRRTGGSV